jgi:hypothetical protein
MDGSGADGEGSLMSGSSMAESFGGVGGRSDSDTRVEADEKPGDAMGSLWLRECIDCDGSEW